MGATVLMFSEVPPPEVARRLRPRLVLVPTGRAVGGAASASLRLTRFGRLVRAVLIAGAIAVAAALMVGQLAGAAGEPRTITVERGQTLSGIAARELPELPVREAVVELQLANGMSSPHVLAGQTLVVPSP